MQLIKEPGSSGAWDLRGATLVLPAVAFANVGELALDVLVANLGGADAGPLPLVARCDEPHVLACAGNNAYVPSPPGQLATALELYWMPGSKLFLLQQRAPAIPGCQRALADSLAAWAQREGVARLLLLCGLDSQFRREAQLEGSQLRYLDAAAAAQLAPPQQPPQQPQQAPQQLPQQPQPSQQQQQEPPSGAAADSLLAGAAAAVGVAQLEAELIATEREVHGLLPPWPLLDAAAAAGVPAALLAAFAAEGDNAQDALQLAAAGLALLRRAGLAPEPAEGAAAGRLRAPVSWVGLFGRRGVEPLLF